jgi:outer membrane protein assembly factor BamB
LTLVLACSGALVGLDRASGHPRWRCAPPGVENRVIDLAIDGDLVVAAYENGRVFGVDYASGQGRWQATFETGSVGGVPPTILIDGAQAHVGCFGRVACFSREGQPLWAFKEASVTPCALGVPGNVRGPHRTRSCATRVARKRAPARRRSCRR